MAIALLVLVPVPQTLQQDARVEVIRTAIDYMGSDLAEKNLVGKRKVMIDMSVPGSRLPEELAKTVEEDISLPSANYSEVVSCPVDKTAVEACTMQKDVLLLSVLDVQHSGDSAVAHVAAYLADSRGERWTRSLRLQLIRDMKSWSVTEVLSVEMS